MSRDLNLLHPDIKPKLDAFLYKCSAEGIDVLVTCTYRSNDEQNELYKQGRTKPGPVVTWAHGGESKHNFEVAGQPASKAFDMVPMRSGKPVWGTIGIDGELWHKVGEIAESCGLQWAGRWPERKREYPHCEID